MALNGMLARGPYDKATSRMRDIALKELPDDAGAYVWLAPAYAAGALVLASFKDTGWPCTTGAGWATVVTAAFLVMSIDRVADFAP